MREIKQNADANIKLFLTDEADHITGKTGLTLAVFLCKDDGASFTAITSVANATEIANGWYNIDLTNSNNHTDTLGDIIVRATATGADPAERLANVVSNLESDTYAQLGAHESNRSSMETSLMTEHVTIQEIALTRLASSAYGTDILATSTTITDGTILSGIVEDTHTINQTYLKVQETGQFKIDFDFTGLSSTEDKINVIYRYFGAGSTNHKVECLMWNYTLLQWDDMLETDKDFPSTSQDSRVELDVPGTISDYFTGASPNIAARVRIDHVSNLNTDHQFWIDFIALGELEQIYVPADNTGISAIRENIEDSIHGLAATQVLVQKAADAAFGTYELDVANSQLILKNESLVEVARWNLTPDYVNPSGKTRV